MKKVENALNDSLGCGKARSLPTLPQILFFLFSIILSTKFTMEEGEESAECAKPHQKLVLKHIASKLLTLPETFLRRSSNG